VTPLMVPVECIAGQLHKKGALREHYGTLRESSRHIEGCSECSRHIEGIFTAHRGNIEGALRAH
jgi:hypothetical protein